MARRRYPIFSAKRIIEVYPEPNRNFLPIADIRINTGEKIEYSNTLLKTISPSLVHVKKEQIIDATNYGKLKFISASDYYDSKIHQKLKLVPNDIIKVLSYRAEGSFFFEFRGNIYAGDCDACLNVAPEQEWWVQLTINEKQYWILINEESINFLDRSF